MADEITQKLGLDASAAITSLRQLRILFQQYAQSVRSAADANTQFNKTGRLITASLSADAAAMAAAQKAVGQLTTQTKRLVQQLNARFAAQNKLNGANPAGPKAPVAATGPDPSGIFASTLASNLLARAISGTTSAIIEGTTAAIDYELTLARIKTIAGTGVGSIQTLSEQIRTLSDEFGRPIVEVAAGQYELLSNQIGSAAEATTVLRAALKLANVTGATTADSVNAISSVINSYNLSASEAEVISAKLFRAVDLGRFTLDEVANSMGRVTVTAAQLGISLDEVLGSLATLTITGVPADEAMTLLSNTMRGLLKPTKAMKELFAELGVSTAEAGIAAFGFQGLLDKIAESSGGSASEIAQLTENVRVARGFLGLTGDQAARAAKNIEEIGKASAQFLQQKNEIILQTNAKQVQTELNEIKNILLVDIGQNGLAVVNDLTKVFGGLSTVVTLAGIAVGSYVAGLALAKVEAIGLITTNAGLSVSFASVATSANGVVVALAPLAAAALPLVLLANGMRVVGLETQRAKDNIDRAADALKNGLTLQAKAATDAQRSRLDGEKKVNDAINAELQRHFIKLAAEYNKDRDKYISTQRQGQEVFKDQLNDRVKAYEDYVNKVAAAEQRARDIARASQEKITDATQQVGQSRFSRSLTGLSEPQQITKQLERVNQLLAEARQLESRGGEANQKIADQYRDQAASLSDQAANTAAQLNNSRLRETAERAISNVLLEQIKSEVAKETAAKKAADTAAAQAAKEKANLSEIKSLQDEITKIQTDAFKSAKSESDVLDSLRKAIPLAEQIQQKLAKAGDVNLAKQLGLESVLSDVRKPFLDALGKEVKLKFAFSDLPNQIQSTLSTQRFSIIIDPQVAQDRLTDLAKQVGVGDTAQRQLPERQASQAQALIDVQAATAKLNAEMLAFGRNVDTNSNSLTQLGQRANAGLAEISRGLLGLGRSPQFQFAKNEMGSLLALVEKAKTDIAASPAEVNLDPLIQKLNELQAAASQGGSANLAASLNELGLAVTALQAEQQRLLEVQNQAAEGSQAIEAQRRLKVELEQQGAAAQGASTGLNGMSNAQTGSASSAASASGASASYSAALQAEAQQALITAQANRQLAASRGGGGTVTRAARGGPIYRANGGPTGFAPRGTDTIPAMLSPGEFVVNARSSRKFFSQLVAINSGRMPAYRANGGPVSNTTIGDVNVNVNSSDPSQIDGRMLANALRRELRRGTISLKG
jgi:TP901 family phage tail tape measure protein